MSQAAKQTITISGKSKRTYKFDLYPKSYSWNSVAGVYLVLRQSMSKYDPIYIGETSDLGDRFQNHHKRTCFERNGWTHLGFLHEKNLKKRRAIESDILGNYKWYCND